ncbi:hypothetical protein [Shouchella clausii]|jgi:hypothetical protein|uniref:hypothetical protein n=2 Tax=Shouchella clausii TaxID=79880 RepID=UPI0020B1C3A1|nr:hypothetical protein [Shouchella clausii]MDO7267020.1 hypothetical protein [Shouchella clausii]MDO7286065.1 hypothetical protein [Shouchella clausii]MEB5478698.1 hypothetical protein [Shouchella clausii]MED4159023.1 hypothetical protein [Shouchella clausii]MED4176844.1 hypothetical protein [Shouchella clausii]
MSLWKKPVSIFMIFTILVFGSASTSLNVSAQSSGDPYHEKFEQLNDVATTTNEVTDPERIQSLKDMSSDAISNNQLELNYLNADLDFDEANILDISYNNENFTSATFPIVGDDYSVISNLTLVFDSDNEVINYSETLITKSDINTFKVTTYFDGLLTQDEVTDIDYISNEELQEELELIHSVQSDDIVQTQGITEIALCISTVALIDLTVARLIAVSCIASCPAVPPICAACIGAVAVVGSANIGAIIACFR